MAFLVYRFNFAFTGVYGCSGNLSKLVHRPLACEACTDSYFSYTAVA